MIIICNFKICFFYFLLSLLIFFFNVKSMLQVDFMYAHDLIKRELYIVYLVLNIEHS
jgi:hypothetical protein